MSWLFGALAILLVLDALRLRGRAAALARLAADDRPVDPDHRFVLARGVVPTEAVRRAASAHARAQGLEVVDLVPADLPTSRALTLLMLIDPRTYRSDAFAPARTAGHAILVNAELLARAGIEDTEDLDPIELVRVASVLKRHACVTADLAIAPGLSALPGDPQRRLSLLHLQFGDFAATILAFQLAFLALLAAAPVLAPIAGAALLAVYHLHPALVLLGTGLHPRDRAWFVLLRTPAELLIWLDYVVPGADGRDRSAEDHRAYYRQALAGDPARFFEPRREQCPLCAGGRLERCVEVPDLLQHKPGRFALDRCRDCGHVFQNPALSLEGLGFYYRDFYEGLGGEALESIFAAPGNPYGARAAAVRDQITPETWLDVGCGHGHFGKAAKDLLPGTRFDGLDLSDSVHEAKRRGWLDRVYQGIFPELAGELAGSYDVVSMSHYLEHTRDPRAELVAAQRVLRSGGVLMVEVPDPDCPLRRLFGGLWLPWFQPQHQHFVSTRNMERLLGELGFEPLSWHRGSAHIPVDFTAAVVLWLGRIAPDPARPWGPGPSWPLSLWRGVLWGLGPALVLLLAGKLLDSLARPLVTRWNWANAYRVVARRI